VILLSEEVAEVERVSAALRLAVAHGPWREGTLYVGRHRCSSSWATRQLASFRRALR
jgi:hypothetical protein